jgi:hypothetical protein
MMIDQIGAIPEQMAQAALLALAHPRVMLAIGIATLYLWIATHPPRWFR